MMKKAGVSKEAQRKTRPNTYSRVYASKQHVPSVQTDRNKRKKGSQNAGTAGPRNGTTSCSDQTEPGTLCGARNSILTPPSASFFLDQQLMEAMDVFEGVSGTAAVQNECMQSVSQFTSSFFSNKPPVPPGIVPNALESKVDINKLDSKLGGKKLELKEDTKKLDPKLGELESKVDINKLDSEIGGNKLDASLLPENLLLSKWNLPPRVLDRYAVHGIKSMFPWQAECLLLPGVLDRKCNLVYSAPTSAGKTLVAELLAIKCMFETKKKVLFILPFVSVTHEKEVYLKQLLGPVGIRVGGFHGGRSPPGGLTAVDLALCTIEKANSIVNHLLEEGKLDSLAGVIVDELHMIGDSHRGYLLELLLTKILYTRACSEGPKGSSKPQEPELESVLPVQIIGMSATLPNLSCVARWLRAQLYCTDFRPVPLVEMLKVGPSLYKADADSNGTFSLTKVKEYNTPCENGHDDEVALLCWESIKEGHSVLIFCPTKNRCESLSMLIVKHLKRLIVEQSSTDQPVTSPSDLIGVCEQLRRTSVGLDSVLEHIIPNGVGFHHAGLTFEEREIVEGAFRQGKLKVLVATSTLSSGVNLPARRVIIRTPIFHGSLLNVQVYKQMVGRAGRKGVDSLGESVLICKPCEKQKAMKLILGSLRPVKSCLGEGSHKGSSKASKGSTAPPAMKRAVLEVIASGAATRSSAVLLYVSSTLFFAELSEVSSVGMDSSAVQSSMVEETLVFLLENDFIGQHEGDETDSEMLYSTQLGIATVASGLGPDDSLVVFRELQSAQRGFVLENELHIIYQVTPISIHEQWPNTDWYIYLRMWEGFSPDVKRVAEMIGVSESFLVRAASGRVPNYTVAQQRSLMIHRRFFSALALHDLVREVPVADVALKYGVSKGLIQSLQTSAGMFAGMVTVFCQKLGWKNLELLLSQFQCRLTFGVERELTDLVHISLLNGQRARALYNAGYHTLTALATANPFAIESILRNAVPFKSYKLDGDPDLDRQSLFVNWCPTLKRGLKESEAAAMIVDEAKQLLAEDFNVPVSTWKDVDVLGVRSKVDNIESTGLLRNAKPVESSGGSRPKLPSNGALLSTEKSVQDREQMELGCIQPAPNMGISTEKRAITEKCLRKSPSGGSHQQGLLKKPKCPAGVSGGDDMKLTELYSPQDGCSHPPPPPPPPLSSPFATPPTFTRNVSTPLTDKKTQNSSSSAGASTRGSRYQDPQCLVSPITLSIKAHGNTPHNTDRDVGNSIGESVTESIGLNPSSMDFSLNLSPKSLSVMDAACKEVVLKTGRPVDGAGHHSTSSVSMVAESPMRGSLSMQSSASWFEMCRDVKLSTLEVNEDPDIIPPTPPQPVNCGLAVQNSKTHRSFLEENIETSDQIFVVPNSPVEVSGSFHDLSLLHSTHDDEAGLTIIDVAADVQLFQTFVAECSEQEYISLSVAKQTLSGGVGMAFTHPNGTSQGIPIPLSSEEVVGVAMCWGGWDVYYIPLVASTKDSDEISPDLPLADRVGGVRSCLTSPKCRQQKLAILDVKRQIRELASTCGFIPAGVMGDPRVADWLLDPDGKEKTLAKMVLHYLSDSPHLLQAGAICSEMPLTTLATHGLTAKLRSVAECVLAHKLMRQLDGLLEAEGLVPAFLKVEMPLQIVLARMESVGIGFSEETCREVETILKTRMLEIEKECYNLARHPFSLSSPEDVARVLFVELHLPSGSDPSSRTVAPPLKGWTKGKGARRRQLQHLSTARDVLEKISHLHPLPGLVLEWRRISSTLAKVVYPLSKESVWHADLSLLRIHYTCHVHTSTGRVNVADPNLQNVPKAYIIYGDSDSDVKSITPSEDGRTNNDSDIVCESQIWAGNPARGELERKKPLTVSMRSVFVTTEDRMLLSADYSQLELRILAHLSGDCRLRSILNSDGDVFKMIASKWLNTSVEDVSPSQRQHAKSICYGMIYGMGPKALAEQLKVGIEEAATFMDSFKSQFPDMQTYIQSTIDECHNRGYVTTLTDRRRHLPGIHSTDVHIRGQSERQAVNSTIQGSAADIVKQAMIAIDHKLTSLSASRTSPNSPQSSISPLLTSPGAMVLQIHDELLFEVDKQCLMDVAALVRAEMESVVSLTVKLPVKLHCGQSWGTMSESKL